MKSILATIKLWFWVSRPVLYPLIPLLFVLGYQAGGGEWDNYRIWLFLWALTWPLSMLVYGINDIFDYEFDLKDGQRSSGIGGCLLQENRVKAWWGIIFAFVSLTLISYYAFGHSGLYFSGAVLLVSLVYSMPPLRIKTRPILDMVFSGWLYGYCVYGFGYSITSHTWPPTEAILLALVAMNIHAIGTLRDYYIDKATSNRTVAVALGYKVTAWLVLVATVFTAITWFLYRGLSFSEVLFFGVVILPTVIILTRDDPGYVRHYQWWFVIVMILVGVIKVFIE